MARSHKLSDIKLRLELFKINLGLRDDLQLLEHMGYENPSSISRIKSGKNGITEDKIHTLTQLCNIKFEDFFLDTDKLAQKLGIKPGMMEAASRRFSAEKSNLQEINQEDKDILQALPGRYAMLYAGAELHDLKSDFTAIEILEFDNLNLNNGTLRARMPSNFITGHEEEGELLVRGARVYVSILYKRSHFPNSTLLLSPYIPNKNNTLLVGLYMDVTKNKRIFCAKTVLFKMDNSGSMPRRFDSQDKLHKIWKPLIENKTGESIRLYAGDGYDHNQINEAVQQTKNQPI